jgi:hypothetical protein
MIRRPVGNPTRGTTNPNRLRRVDNWLTYALGGLLRRADDPLVVDLGFGASPITTVELRARLARVRPDVRVIGLEIDPVRVATAAVAAHPPGLEFRRGGFELAGLRPTIVRAMNVLRQYDEAEVGPAWAAVRAALAPDGILIDGTCDELGRLGAWLALPAAASTGPASTATAGAGPGPGPAGAGPDAATGPGGAVTLTFAANLARLDRPAEFAERLPKALIHRNVPGEPIHALLQALDHAWRDGASYTAFGARQRFVRAVAATRAAGWPVRHEPRRWRHGEFTVTWGAVHPLVTCA